MEENEDVIFSHGEAEYFNSDNSSSLQWRYFEERSGIYELNKEVAERILSFTYVCFGGCMVRNSIWPEISLYLENENMIIKNYLDLLVVILLFGRGKLYFHNVILARIRIENDTRNRIQSNLISDAAAIWNFLEKNKTLYSKIEKTSVDINHYKGKQFLEFGRALIYEYNHNCFGLDDFRAARANLMLFNLRLPFKYSIYLLMVSVFPKFSNLVYRIAKMLLRGKN
jgi:hypothetical protein